MDQEAIRKIFSQFDTNSNGTISRSELSKLAVALNNTLDNADLADWFKSIDIDRSGTLSFDEFIKYCENN